MVRILPDNVNHIIDGDPTQQAALLVYHRRRDQVVAFKQCRYLGVGEAHGNGLDVGIHDFPHGGGGVGDQHFRDGQHANEIVPPADHDQAVGHGWQGAVPAKVAEHNIDTDVRAHRNGVRVHQTAGGVLRVGENFLHPLPVLLVHGLQDFLDDRIRQLLQQVGQVV